MTKTKWPLALLAVMDIVLLIMHFSGYYFIFLLPTGYILPLILNILILSIMGFRSARIRSFWVIIGLMLSIPILLLHALMVSLLENNYTTIDSPDNRQSLVIEHRNFTLGETTYYYEFYKTKFGLIGKHLDGQPIRVMVRSSDMGDGGDESAIGWENAQWITKDVVRFPTLEGEKDVYLNPTSTRNNAIQNKKEENQSFSSEMTERIDIFMKMAEKKEDGQAIEINGNRLEVRYDKSANESWIEVENDKESGAIPRQQCSRIVRNEENGYYMLEECTHRWEYRLYPLGNGEERIYR